jgi:calnexin
VRADGVEELEQPTSSNEQKFEPGQFVEPSLDLAGVYFVDYLNDPDALGKTWKVSTARKEGLEESLAKYNGHWAIGAPSKVVLENDYGLIAQSKARHHAIAALLTRPIAFTSDELVVQ